MPGPPGPTGPTGGDAGASGAGGNNDSEWIWAPEMGVYHHKASGTYALPDGSGWRYLTSDELAQRTSTGGADKEEPEEGEIEDDVGWGALMDPEKLAKIESTKNPVYTAAPGRSRDSYGRETYSDGTPIAGDPLLAHEEDDSKHLLRLVVRRSQVLDVDSVAVLDARRDGTQLGRDRGVEARLRIKEMEVSKTHAVVFYQPAVVPSPRRRSRSPSPYGSRSRTTSPEKRPNRQDRQESGWFVSDLGSTLGTYVAHPGEEDAKRLSEAKCASAPYALRHGDKLTVGRTTFAVHIHADWPCEACQLSGNQQIDLEDGRLRPKSKDKDEESFELDTFALNGNGTRKGRQALKRRREMDALRGNLLGEEDQPKRPVAAGYVDRSAQRRRLHPPSPPRYRDRSEEARPVVMAPPQPAGPSEVARKLLAKQGWNEGQGLGRTPGRAEPIVPVVRNERAGLGVRGEVADQPSEGGDWRQRGRQRRWAELEGK